MPTIRFTFGCKHHFSDFFLCIHNCLWILAGDYALCPMCHRNFTMETLTHHSVSYCGAKCQFKCVSVYCIYLVPVHYACVLILIWLMVGNSMLFNSTSLSLRYGLPTIANHAILRMHAESLFSFSLLPNMFRCFQRKWPHPISCRQSLTICSNAVCTHEHFIFNSFAHTAYTQSGHALHVGTWYISSFSLRLHRICIQ